MELKREMDKSTITVGDINTSLSAINKATREKIIKAIKDLNTISQVDITDIYRTLYPTAEYAFFSCTHGTFTKKEHVLS